MFSKTKAVASGAAQGMSDMPGAQRVIGVGQQGLVDPEQSIMETRRYRDLFNGVVCVYLVVGNWYL